jgi:hypothetical protein
MKKLLLLSATAFMLMNSYAQSGKLVLEKGQKLTIENNVKAITNMEMMGQSMESTNESKTIQQAEVNELTASGYAISATVTKLVTSGSAMGQTFSFDSDKKEDLESETGQVLKSQLNVKKEMEFSNSGALTLVKKAETTTTEDSNPMAAMMKSMSGMAPDESNGVSDAIMVIPAQIKQGDTWQDSVISDGMKITRTYTLKELSGGNAKVTLTGMQKVDKKMEMQGMEIGIAIESKMTGELIVDANTGIVKQRTINMEGAGNADAMGQAIPLTTKITITGTVK